MLLFIDGCLSQRGEESRTRRLAESFLTAWWAAHPGEEVETVGAETLLSLRPFAPAALDERDALASVGAWEAPVFALARQFRAADEIAVAAPFWDLSFPAAVRTYIEHICARGVTYHYTAQGCVGDCRAGRLTYLTSGGDVERPESLGVLYWRQLAAMCGIGEYAYVFAGGLDLGDGQEEARLADACALAARLGAREDGHGR